MYELTYTFEGSEVMYVIHKSLYRVINKLEKTKGVNNSVILPSVLSTLTKYNNLYFSDDCKKEDKLTITLNCEDIVNLSYSLNIYIEELTSLIIKNKSDGYPTDLYESDMHMLYAILNDLYLLKEPINKKDGVK